MDLPDLGPSLASLTHSPLLHPRSLRDPQDWVARGRHLPGSPRSPRSSLCHCRSQGHEGPAESSAKGVCTCVSFMEKMPGLTAFCTGDACPQNWLSARFTRTGDAPSHPGDQSEGSGTFQAELDWEHKTGKELVMPIPGNAVGRSCWFPVSIFMEGSTRLRKRTL